MIEPRQIVLISDPERLFQSGELFPKSDVALANGKIPIEAEGRADAVCISTDAEWCRATVKLLVAAKCGRVRWSVADLSDCKTNAEAIAALKLAGISEYLPVDTEKALNAVCAMAKVPGESTASGSSSEPVDQPKAAPIIPENIPPLTDPVKNGENSPNSGKSTGSPTDEPKEPTVTAQDEAELDRLAQIPPEGAESSVRPLRKRRPRLSVVDDGNLARSPDPDPDPDPDPVPASLSEDALAEHFVETRGERWRYVPEWGVWLEWRGDGWHRDTLFKVSHECKEITRECLLWKEAAAGPWGPALSADGKRKISSRRMAWAVRDMAAVHPKISILAAELDADPWMLGVPGGVVDLKNGKLLAAEPEQYITRRTLIAPEDGPHPLFDRVFARACSDHDGMAAYLWRWFGYMLTGDVRAEAFIFLYGPGGSGKSTLIKCLTDILGDYAVSIAMDALMEQKNPRHTQEIAKLAGMRLIYASETSEGRLWNEALVKDLTGRDTITARFMRGNDFNFKICGKLLLYGNAMPRLKSVGEEIRRRIHLIEYAGSLAEGERDETIKDRLVAEYPAILASMIRGCVDWQDCHGLGKPESVTVSVESYLEGEDTFADFLAECIQPDRMGSERTTEVYRRYGDWARDSGEKYTLSMKRFVQTMRTRGYESSRTAAGKMLSGLRLLAAPPSQDPRSYQDRD